MAVVTKTEPKAIETIYNGYRFRSRIEARWAVFFDTLGVKYEYEKESYNLDGIGYLPDFWLPGFGCWIEVKGKAPSLEEIWKAHLLAKATGAYVHIFFGSIPFPISTAGKSRKMYVPFSMTEQKWQSAYVSILGDGALQIDCANRFRSRAVVYTNCCWFECTRCRMHFMSDYPISDGGCCGCEAKFNAPKLMEAYTAARQARFEWGETPATRQ